MSCDKGTEFNWLPGQHSQTLVLGIQVQLLSNYSITEKKDIVMTDLKIKEHIPVRYICFRILATRREHSRQRTHQSS